LNSYTIDVKNDKLITSCKLCRQFTEHDLRTIEVGTELRCAPKRCPEVMVLDDALLATIRELEILRRAERAQRFRLV
jgi:hypothetical protein